MLRIGTKPPWPRLRDQLATMLADAFPDTDFTIADPRSDPLVAWHLGPTETAVATAIGDIPGWSTLSVFAGIDPDAPPKGAVLALERTVTARALAGAVVRYRAAHPRPFDPADDRARRRLWQILDEDDPEHSGYPLSDAMADLLLAEAGDATTAEALAARLEALGFDTLWNRAWATTPL